MPGNGLAVIGRFEVPYCFDVRFRTPRPVADKLEEVFKSAAFKQTLRCYRPDGMNMHDGWVVVESCGYADFGEAQASGTRFQEGLLIAAANQKVGVEFYLRGAEAKAVNVYPRGRSELRDPGLPLPTILSEHELKEMVGAAVESATSLTANQRVAAELLNNSFFKMSPEASFLLRVSAVEALCPQAAQTDTFQTLVDSVRASIPKDTWSPDRDQIEQSLKRLAARQSVRSAYMSKITQLIGTTGQRSSMPCTSCAAISFTTAEGAGP